MALDPSIALGVKPLELANPLAQYGQIAQIQNAQNQNALAQYQLATAQREQEATNALNRAYAEAYNPATGAIDANKLRQSLSTGGFGSKLPAVEKGLLELGKLKTETQKAEGDVITQRLDLSKRRLENVRTPQEYVAWHEANHKDPVLRSYFDSLGITADSARANIEAKINQPGGFAELLRGSALGLEKSMEQHFAEQNLGGTTRTISMPKYALPGAPSAATVVPGSEAKKTMTPGEIAVDARARERLAAETATGALTPASLDLAANIYLQTGQLPTGMGKSASGLRSQVMNRATELAGGKPAADLAGGIVEAKQDVAARGKSVRDFSTGKQGDAVRSFNTAIDHLDTMSKLATALQNNDTRLFNTAGNAFAAATGQAAPTDFDSAKAIVGGEVAKALTGSNMALKDREEIRDTLSRANSPAQLAGTIRRMQELMGGQLNSLKLQYETSTGRKDFDKKLTSRSTEVVQSLHGGSPAPGAAPAGPKAGTIQDGYRFKGGNPADPKSWEKV